MAQGTPPWPDPNAPPAPCTKCGQPAHWGECPSSAARIAVLNACSEILGTEPADTSKTFDQLGADSLDMVEITMEVEERLLIELEPYGCEIGPEMTVANFIALVERVAAPVAQSQLNGVA